MLIKPRGSHAWLLPFALFAAPAISAVDPQANVSETYGEVPLQFEENRATVDEAVRFLARGPGYSLHLTPTEAVLVLAKPGEKAADTPSKAVALRMRVVGARSTSAMTGVDELPGKASYFVGNDPSKWRTNIPIYAKVRHSGVYPGIDLVYYGQQRQLEYDFVVAPGADPDQIVLGFEGADAIDIDAQGDLVLHNAAGDVRQHKPVIYQEDDGIRHRITGGYVRKDTTRIGFRVAEYDRSRPLVIDPVLSYSTYLGGSAVDGARAIAVDGEGNVYVTGHTFSTNFPTTPGALQASNGTSQNAFFVAKLNSTGTALLYSALFGGVPTERAGINDPFVDAKGLAIDSDHNVYVTGATTSPTFPTTGGAFRTSPPAAGHAVGFVTKLNATGSALVYSTYLGGSDNDWGAAIALDADRNAYVTGRASSGDFPTTAGAFRTSPNGGPEAFVTKLAPSGGALVYSTYLGGATGNPMFGSDGFGIAVDAAGEAYVVGVTGAPDFPTTVGAFQTALRGRLDAFVTKLNSAGSALVYSTYLGGSSGANAESSAFGVAVDASGAYVVGRTNAADFPVTPGAFQTQMAPSADAFITKLDTSGSALVYSTYLGGSNNETATAIAVDVDGNAFVTGTTESQDFPVTADACVIGYRGNGDAFVVMLDPKGAKTVYSTYVGGSGADAGAAIAVDTGGNAYVAGGTGPNVPAQQVCVTCTDGADDFPTTPHAFQAQYGGGQRDGFVVKIAEPVLPLPAPTPAASASATGSPSQMPASSANVAESGQSGAGGGGAFDWFTLSALLATLAFARRRRAGA